MLLGAGGFAANPDGPFLVEFCKTTTILGATLLSNDVAPNGATIISVSAAVGGFATLVLGDVEWLDDGLNGLTPASFNYTIQDNSNPLLTSTATVTLQPFFAVTSCVDDGPSFAIATEFHPLILPKFGGGTITANDTFGGATSPPPNTANPVTVTVLTPNTPVYSDLFDLSIPGIYTLVIPPGTNQIEIECWGAQGGRGGDLSNPGGASGQPQQVAGLGAHRLVTNLAVTPGQILSIAVGGAGGIGDTTAGQGLPNNIGTGGLGGQGFADNSTSPTGGILGTGQHDSFGFPDGAGVSALGGRGVCTNCDGLGGRGGSDGTPPSQPTNIVAPGGGGGAGSGVTVGDATTSNGTPLNRLGPVLNVAGGGGGGSGASVTDTSRGPGQDGGPPDPNRIPSISFFGSNGQTAGGGGATGGGGGGYRGGHSFPNVDIFTGQRIGFGGESNDERYKVAGERFAGNKTPSIQFGVQEVWPAFSGSTTTEFASVQVGNGRVRIRGRTIVDQLGGTQFPIDCKVVDLGATIEVTPDIPFNPSGFASRECSFFYFLTDIKTGQISGVCEVKVDIVANVVTAVNDGPFNVFEASTNASVATKTTLLANDTVSGVLAPSEGTVNMQVVSFSGNVNAASFVGSNLRVDTGNFAAGAVGTVTYEVSDPLMPVGFELLPNRAADTADVAIEIKMPCLSADFDADVLFTDLQRRESNVVNVPKASLIGAGSCGSEPCIFVSAFSAVNCTIADVGADIQVTLGAASGNNNCTFQFFIRNAEGAGCPTRTCFLTSTAPAFSPFIDSGSHAGLATTGILPTPSADMVNELKITVHGAEGGTGGSFTFISTNFGAAGGKGGHTEAIVKLPGVGAAGAGYSFEYHCGSRGSDGGNSISGLGGANGPGGSGNIAPLFGFGYPAGISFDSARGGSGHPGGGGGISCSRGGGAGGGGGSGVRVAAGSPSIVLSILAAAGGGGGGRGGGSSSPSGTQTGGAGNSNGGSNRGSAGEPSCLGPFGPIGCAPPNSGIGGAGAGYNGGQVTSSGLACGTGFSTTAEGGRSGSDFGIGAILIAFTELLATQTGNGQVIIEVRERIP